MVEFLELKDPIVNKTFSIRAEDPFVFLVVTFFFSSKEKFIEFPHYLRTLSVTDRTLLSYQNPCDQSPGMAWLALTLVAAAAQAAL